MIVLKFGGTSVADAAAIERLVDIVRGRMHASPVVVVSAFAGTTNALLAVAEQAAKGHLIGASGGVRTLRDRHLRATDTLLGDSAGAADVAAEVSTYFDELARLAEAISVFGYVTPRTLDAIAAFGELCSSRIVAAAMQQRGVPGELLDARDVVVTNDEFTEAVPQPDVIAARGREHILPLVQQGKVPVLGGFIGRSRSGLTTTLGRGGSDYTASLIGAALHAESIEIWTDVDGMLTADPRVVTDARLIERIRFDEAAELASFGAKVLHPNTIAPAVKVGIPVYVLNSERPEGVGTMITFDAPHRPVTAIAGKGAVTVVKVRSARMLLAHGILRRIFETFERHEVSVDVVATSEVSVSVTVDDDSRLEDVVVELAAIGDVSIERDRGVVAVVGCGLSDGGDAMGRALLCLRGHRLYMLSLSATGINLTAVLDGAALADAMRALHTEFFGGGS
ncbi:MAG TPA: aspartate kinase [Gemmatimonadaceae bacterium]|nr:aspartate kinase [Gemmatimonadaceae bacterium]